jgi:hypothetical protein
MKNKNKIIWLNMHSIDWKSVAQIEQYKGSNSWKEVIAHKRKKSILMAMW